MQPTSFPFGKEIRSYKQPEITTPFQRQGQTFDRPIGQSVQSAYIWRIVFFIATFCSLLFVLVLINLLNSIPYRIVVEQITDKGYLKSPPVFLNLDYQVSEPILAAFIKHHVLNLRNFDQLQDFLSEDAEKALEQQKALLKNSSLKSLDFSDFSIHGTSFNGVLLNHQGKPVLSVSGSFSQKTLDELQDLSINPLGIYIDKILIQRL